MTTMSFNQAETYFSSAPAAQPSAAIRAAHQEHAVALIRIAGVAARCALALVPFLALAECSPHSDRRTTKPEMRRAA